MEGKRMRQQIDKNVALPNPTTKETKRKKTVCEENFVLNFLKRKIVPVEKDARSMSEITYAIPKGIYED